MGDRDIDRSRYRYIEGDLIEEAGKQKRNKKEGREPRYRTGGINRDIDRSKYRYIEGDLIEEAGKQKENRGDERNPIYRKGKKENKANNK